MKKHLTTLLLALMLTTVAATQGGSYLDNDTKGSPANLPAITSPVAHPSHQPTAKRNQNGPKTNQKRTKNGTRTERKQTKTDQKRNENGTKTNPETTLPHPLRATPRIGTK